MRTVAGVLQTTTGPIIGIFHNYAHHGKGHTIHSPLQMEAFGVTVDDRSRHLQRGVQQITTPEGHVIPLSLKNGLFYMEMHPPSDEELDTIPHVFMTSPDDWDPDMYNDDSPFDDVPLPESPREESKTSGLQEPYEQVTHDDHIHSGLAACKGEILIQKPRSILPFKPDLTKLRPLFGWAPVSRIRDI